MLPYQTKSIPLDLKDLDSKQGIITGYASRFGNVDSGGDRINPGAFKRTIKNWGPQGKNRIKNLLHHDPTKLVGRPIELLEDEQGLLHRTQISQTTLGKDTLILLEDGVFTEQSIGYSVINESNDGDVRDLLELKLFEYSYVTWGMNPETPILGVKSAVSTGVDVMLVLQEQFDKVEACLSGGDWQTEEIPSMLELTLKHWQKELDALMTHPIENERITLRTKEGRTLSKATKAKLVSARDAIQSLLDLDENKDLDSASSSSPAPDPASGAEAGDTPAVPLEAATELKSVIQSIGTDLATIEFSRELDGVIENLEGKQWNN